MKNKNIVVIGIQPWDIEIGSNCKNLALEFSKKNKVLYVNSPLDRFTAYRQKSNNRIQKRKKIIEGKIDAFESINKNLTVFYPRKIIESISSLRSDFLFDLINKYNNKRFASEIQFAIDTLNMNNYVLFNDSDMFRSFYIKELLQPKVYLYYTRDNLIAVDFWKTQGIRIEAKHMAKADAVVANSTYLARLGSKHNPKSYFVGQGCDTKAFSIDLPQKIPKDVEHIKKPIIGYIGALKSLRLDIDILLHIARTKPNWNLLLVGPEDMAFKESELHNLPNVYFTGNKQADELPSYLSVFDVALNPQLLNEVTIGNYPRKIDEYLAMGKACVATKTEAMDLFKKYVYLASSKKEYVDFIDQALLDDDQEKRISRAEFASTHTWENNAKHIYDVFKKFIKIKR